MPKHRGRPRRIIVASIKPEAAILLRVLDKTRPYAEVHGLPGAAYEQDGIRFKGDFTESKSENESPYVEEVPDPEDNSEVPAINIIEQQTSPDDRSNGEALDTMNEKTLKLLIGSYGEQWPGDKKSAIDILKGINKKE